MRRFFMWLHNLFQKRVHRYGDDDRQNEIVDPHKIIERVERHRLTHPQQTKKNNHQPRCCHQNHQGNKKGRS